MTPTKSSRILNGKQMYTGVSSVQVSTLIIEKSLNLFDNTFMSLKNNIFNKKNINIFYSFI